jgi:hypothetical protein
MVHSRGSFQSYILSIPGKVNLDVEFQMSAWFPPRISRDQIQKARLFASSWKLKEGQVYGSKSAGILRFLYTLSLTKIGVSLVDYQILPSTVNSVNFQSS